MAHTYEELKSLNVAQLREIADTVDDEALKGHSTMHKEHLLPTLCKALGIETHAHHEVVGIDKGSVKEQIKRLKGQRDEALAAHDHTALKRVRRQIHHLKRRMHKATV